MTRPHRTRRFLLAAATSAALLFACNVHRAAAQEAYEYPITNPYVATVLGTPVEYKADLPDEIPLVRYTLELEAPEAIPEVFWYERGLHFGLAEQSGEAPLVFVIAGTGGHYNSGSALKLARLFYGAGYHVVSMSSPTHLNFLVNASRNRLPGFPSVDAADLYDVMLAAWEEIREDVEVSDFFLAGFSLGGSHAAYLAKIDEQRRGFGFKRVVMINPAVNLYSSAAIFDDLLETAIPYGTRGVGIFLNGVVRDLAVLYRKTDVLRLDGEFVYAAYEQTKSRFPPAADAREVQVAQALIAIAFRMASANMVFGSDVMNRTGYLVPPTKTLGKYESLTPYARASHAVKFTEYADDLVIPTLQAETPELSRDEILARVSLRAIEDYLRDAEHISVITNEDEIILGPGELDYLKGLFAGRISVYPHGGHGGNIDHKQTAARIVELLQTENR